VDAYLDHLFSLRGRTAVVTGGSSGIGRAMALALSQAGAAVVVVARRREPLQQAVDEMRATGGRADMVRGDLGDRAGTHEVADELLATYPAVDILVNSAGLNLRPPLSELTEDDWDRTMRVNLGGWCLSRRGGPDLVDLCGRLSYGAGASTVG